MEEPQAPSNPFEPGDPRWAAWHAGWAAAWHHQLQYRWWLTVQQAETAAQDVERSLPAQEQVVTVLEPSPVVTASRVSRRSPDRTSSTG